MVRYLFICFFIGIIVISYSCNETKTCTEVMISHFNVEFFNKKTMKDTVFDSIAFNPPNSMYSNVSFLAKYTHAIPLPLSPKSDTTTFLLSFYSSKWHIKDTMRIDTIKIPIDSIRYDTTFFKIRIKDSVEIIRQDHLIVIYKRPPPIFVSYDCGFRNEFTLDTLWSQSGFDSLKIIQPKISNLNDINCKIYLNPFTGK